MKEAILRNLGYAAAAAGDPLPALAREAEELRDKQQRVEELLSLAVEAHGGIAPLEDALEVPNDGIGQRPHLGPPVENRPP